MKIGQKIRNAREDKDLTQKDMARLIPMNQSNYSKIERDFQEPNLTQLKRICEILSINPSFLFDLHSDCDISPEDKKLLSDIKAFISIHKSDI